MATSSRRKPLRGGALALREGFVVGVSSIVSEFAPEADVDEQRAAASQLQRACQFYVAHRDGHISPKTFRTQITLLKKSAEGLHRRIAKLSDFTRAELYINNDGRSGGLDGVERNLTLLLARLETLQAEESMKGRDYADPPGSLLVQDLLATFMSLKRRAKPPSIRFDAPLSATDADDVSSTEFGRFVIAVEAAVVSGMGRQTDKSAEKYRLLDKRAAITGAIARADTQ